jgi:hypothetical protein
MVVARRRDRSRTQRKHRETVVDQELARLTPSGHEVALPASFLLPVPTEAPSVPAARALDTLERISDQSSSPPDTDALRALWAAEAVEVGDAEQIERHRTMPLEMRISGEQELLENSVQTSAREAVETEDPAMFDVKRTELSSLVDSLRPFRVAEAGRNLAREMSLEAVTTDIGPVLMTDLGVRLLQARTVLPADVTFDEALAALDAASREAAQKTSRMEALYQRLPEGSSRPAVAAALTDLTDDPDEAIGRYQAVLEALETRAPALERDGLDALPSPPSSS